MTERNLIIIVGQEGAGKSTTIRALLPALPHSAQIDAEDVGTVNPWQMDDAFIRLLHRNVACLTHNFWDAGYHNVIAGSFLSNYDHYRAFRATLDAEVNTYLVHLCAGKPARDIRRIERPKESSQEWRDMVDLVDPEDTTLRDHTDEYHYLRIDNDRLKVEETVELICFEFPALYAVSKTG